MIFKLYIIKFYFVFLYFIISVYINIHKTNKGTGLSITVTYTPFLILSDKLQLKEVQFGFDMFLPFFTSYFFLKLCNFNSRVKTEI